MIHQITDMHGVTHATLAQVGAAFLNYYTTVVSGLPASPDNTIHDNLSIPKLSADLQYDPISPISDEEITNSIFTMRKSAFSGPDGFTVSFYSHCWAIISSDVYNAIHNFFNKSRLLSSINFTNLALIPKTTSPTVASQYRPITCCNVIYKSISRILASRLKNAL